MKKETDKDVALNAIRIEHYFRERSGRGDIGKARRILAKAGRDTDVQPGDAVEP